MVGRQNHIRSIAMQFGLKEQEVIDLMRLEMKPSSFRMYVSEFKEEKQNTKIKEFCGRKI
jgi:uncharacterized protein (TIGR03643 family)